VIKGQFYCGNQSRIVITNQHLIIEYNKTPDIVLTGFSGFSGPFLELKVLDLHLFFRLKSAKSRKKAKINKTGGLFFAGQSIAKPESQNIYFFVFI